MPAAQPLMMSIDQITPGENPGQYVLYGQTSLPDGTELSLSAVRSLTNSGPEARPTNDPIYDILARQAVTPENGHWQTQLSLWQVAPDRTYQENWQRQQTLTSIPLSPSQEVQFLLTLNPATFAQKTENRFKELKRLGDHPLFNVTPAGEPYLEARKTITIPLPNAQMVPVVAAPEPSDYPWADRASQNPAGTTRENQSELPFSDSDNLPLTTSNLLQ